MANEIITVLFQQRLLAKALYDNVAESPDELAFKRGDLITILEQDTGGLEGWWLCSLRGKQGIAPGNRLKMVTGQVANHVRAHTMDNPEPNVDQEWNRRSWDGSSNKVCYYLHTCSYFLIDSINNCLCHRNKLFGGILTVLLWHSLGIWQ